MDTSSQPSGLPPGQTRILTFFADAEDAGRQPSRAEVATAMGYAFPSAVSKHVDALVRKGFLEADRTKKRNVRLTERGWAAISRSPGHRGVPVVGAIAAGTPILASENTSSYLQDLAPRPGRFALQVRGDSMINVGILDGDLAIIQQADQVRDGDIAAVVVEGEATLKRVRQYPDRIELIAENPQSAPRIIPREQMGNVQIAGQLCFVYRSVR
jgi:repressor LexA